MPEGRRSGFLVLADISGYTALLTGTELEHAQGIIEDLCQVIHRGLVPALTFVKLEGDALFCHGDGSRFTEGERLLELIESCYYDFGRRLDDMRRNTTCACAACASIGSLDLKFVAHYGEFVARAMMGVEDLAGPDVILVHRLLKNDAAAHAGSRGYALVTEACLKRLPDDGRWVGYTEQVESMGEVACAARDLKPAAADRRDRHRVYIEEPDAHIVVRARVAAPPATVWQYWHDADKRVRWQTDMRSITYEANADHRIAEGAIGHCDHGSWASDARYVDWRPFSYFTLERVTTRSSIMAPPACMETLQLTPVEDGTATDVSYRMRARTRAGAVKMRLAGGMVRRMFRRQLGLLGTALQEDGVIASGR